MQVYPADDRAFLPYEGFANAYGGDAMIARLAGPGAGAAIGCGVARYEGVRTVWVLPFDEMIYVIDGEMTVRSGDISRRAVAGDVLLFPRLVPVEYDAPGRVTVFYVKHPA